LTPAQLHLQLEELLQGVRAQARRCLVAELAGTCKLPAQMASLVVDFAFDDIVAFTLAEP